MMKFMTILASLWLLAGAATAANIDGAYERVSLINTRNGESPEAANRVGLLLIGNGHYAMITVNPERRVLSRDDANALPAAEKIRYLEEWLDINAHSGRLQLDGDQMLWHRQVSEDPREVGTTTTLGWRMEGELLILSFTIGNGDRYDWTWRRRAVPETSPDDK